MKKNPKIVDLRQKIEANDKMVCEKFDAHDEALAKDPDAQMSAEDIVAIKDANKATEAYKHELVDLLDMEGIRVSTDRRVSDSRTAVNGFTHPSDDQGTDRGRGRQSIGNMVVNDKEMAAFIKDLPKQPQKSRIDSPPVHLGGELMQQMRGTLFTGGDRTSAGAFIVPDRTNIFDMGTFMRPLTLRELFTQGTTESDVVEFVKVTSFTNNAAPVAEAIATSGTSGTKPESGANLAVAQANVKTIAHWLPATRRAVQDVGQLRTLVDTLLMYGLDEDFENELAGGDGTGEHFTGVLNAAGTTAQAFDADLITTTRKGRTKVRTVGRAKATAYVMNPLDWETFDLLKDNEGRYYYGGPSVLGTPTLWGLPVVECEAFPAGTAMVAAWPLGVIWDREQSSISTSDSHADFFIRNMVAILAELRAAFDLIRPAAFVELDLTA